MAHVLSDNWTPLCQSEADEISWDDVAVTLVQKITFLQLVLFYLV